MEPQVLLIALNNCKCKGRKRAYHDTEMVYCKDCHTNHKRILALINKATKKIEKRNGIY